MALRASQFILTALMRSIRRFGEFAEALASSHSVTG